MIPCLLTDDSTIYYSAEEHLFYTENMKPIRIDSEELFTGNDYDTINLRIVLGRKCNFKCSYCIIQNNEDKEVGHLTPDELCDELIRIAGDRKFGGILFWGGEPLLYINEIKKIYERLNPYCSESKFGNFFLITNGLELQKQDITDWLIEKKFNVTVSYDGEGQILRSVNIFKDENILNAAKRFIKEQPDRFCVLPVFSKTNNSLVKFKNHLIKIFGKDIPNIGHTSSTIIVSDEMRKDLIPIEDLPKFHDETLVAVLSGYLNNWHQPYDKMINFLEYYGQPDKIAICSAISENTLVTDMAGDIVYCHNADKTKCSPRTGNSFLLSNLKDIEDGGQFPWAGTKGYNKPDRCKRCLVNRICNSDCGHVQQKYLKETCTGFYYYNLIFINYLLYVITGQVLKEYPPIPEFE